MLLQNAPLTVNMQAIKEFSKNRLRRQSKFALLRQTRSPAARNKLDTPRRVGQPMKTDAEQGNPLNLIRSEIASLKKLNHVNVANLIEVIDNPQGDSLYMSTYLF